MLGGEDKIKIFEKGKRIQVKEKLSENLGSERGGMRKESRCEGKRYECRGNERRQGNSRNDRRDEENMNRGKLECSEEEWKHSRMGNN